MSSGTIVLAEVPAQLPELLMLSVSSLLLSTASFCHLLGAPVPAYCKS